MSRFICHLYYLLTHAQFPDTKTFTNQCPKDPSFMELAKEVQFLQSKPQLAAMSPESLSDMEKFPELQHLLGFLPPPPPKVVRPAPRSVTDAF